MFGADWQQQQAKAENRVVDYRAAVSGEWLSLLAEYELNAGQPLFETQLTAQQELVLNPLAFRAFAQGVFYKPLDIWQLDMCNRLEDVARTTGRRVLIHCPPQFGKTVILSQRFPAYCLGLRPEMRIRLLMYNITHAKNKGGRIVKDIVRSAEFKRYFANPELDVPRQSQSVEWSTLARRRLGDGQPSFKCFGLDTGATGEGGDLWLFDDPYPSEAQAFSEAYNNAVWSAWEGTVKPRLGLRDNVVVMFHRYQVGDFAGVLLEREPDAWELWRYPAIADGDYEVEGTGKVFPAYPLSRIEGEVLSDRFTRAWYDEKKASGRVWRGQFQGRPTEDSGETFNVAIFRQPGMIVDAAQVPAGLPTCRAWDFAASEGRGARSAGVKMAGPDKAGIIYVLDVRKGQKATEGRMRLVAAAAASDGYDCEVGFPTDPGSAGKDTAYFTARELIGHRWWTFSPRQDKEIRAQPFADALNIGLVKLVRGSWNGAYIEELRQFPTGTFKDQVDASADAYKRLARKTGRQKRRTQSFKTSA